MQQQTIRVKANTIFESKPKESRVKSSVDARYSRFESGTLRSKILRFAGEVAWGLKPTILYSMSNTVK